MIDNPVPPPPWWDSVKKGVASVHTSTRGTTHKTATKSKKPAGSTAGHHTKGAVHKHLISKTSAIVTQDITRPDGSAGGPKTFRVTTRVYDIGGAQFTQIAMKPVKAHVSSSGKKTTSSKTTSKPKTSRSTSSRSGGNSRFASAGAVPPYASPYAALQGHTSATIKPSADFAAQFAAMHSGDTTTNPLQAALAAAAKAGGRAAARGSASLTNHGKLPAHAPLSPQHSAAIIGHTSTSFAPPRVPLLAAVPSPHTHSKQARRHKG
jgi:hypothetical protein